MIKRIKPNMLKKNYPYLQISDHLLPKGIIWVDLLRVGKRINCNKPYFLYYLKQPWYTRLQTQSKKSQANQEKKQSTNRENA